ncbi:hypothetical protein LQ759_16210 [Serratia marcescens]|nr:hypothetical protein [Serratia marcescens]
MSVEALPISSGGKPRMPQDKPAAATRPSEYSANSAYFPALSEYEAMRIYLNFYAEISEVLKKRGLIAVALFIYRSGVIIIIKTDNGNKLCK